MASASVPIIVGGFYRSGTSLVRRLLDAHRNIHCPPEVKFFPDFYQLYRHDALAHVRFFTTARSLGLPEPELLEIFGGAYCEARRRAAEARGKRRWADKIPENVLYLDEWRALLPGGFRFVNVVRNPLDALGSLKEAGFEKTVPPAFTDRVAYCRRFREAGDAYAARFPDVSFHLGYEELARAPETMLSTLFAFLGETFESDVIAHYRAATREVGLEDPKVRATDHIHADSIGRSRAHLSPGERRLAEAELDQWL